jgi:hypothetical protein
MDKWFKLLREDRASRGSPEGIRRAMGDFLDKGPQTGGSPYKEEDDEKPRLKGKKNRNQVSAPPGAPAGLEEEVEPDSFDKNSQLEPHFWKEDKLRPKIAQRLIKIAKDFLEGLEVDVEIDDIRFTGSLANYNWSKYSDIDLHLVVDFSKLDSDTEMVKSFFDASRMRWNGLHAIKIYGYEVEVYVENVGDVHRSSGIYSIMNESWVVEPDPTDVTFDFAIARMKSDDILTQINMIEKIAADNPRSALSSIERLKKKIRNMRSAGLKTKEQEFSPQNIAFKILRREDALQRLSDLRHDAYDRTMSMVQ